MPPAEVIVILGILALAGNLYGFYKQITPPPGYYFWLSVGCFIVVFLYLYLCFYPGAPLLLRATIARWGFINLLIPMCYPIIYILGRWYYTWKRLQS